MSIFCRSGPCPRQISHITGRGHGPLLQGIYVYPGVMSTRILFMKFALLIIIFLVPALACADIKVVDDAGRTVVLHQPAKRVISLSPHITELLYAAGAGERVVGVVSFSDYPPQAKKLPLIGSNDKFDLEAIVSLKPDLIVAWQNGNPKSQVEQLIKLGFKVYITEPREFEDIAKDIKQIGQLLGTQRIADQAAANFSRELQDIRRQYAGRAPVRVFYQVWNNPLFTVNGEHLISKVINLCGGVNVFSDLRVLSPQVSIESVIAKNPDVIFYGSHETREDWALGWRQWKNIKAVANQHLFGIHADLIVRHTPRILQGAKQMCEALDQVRASQAAVN